MPWSCCIFGWVEICGGICGVRSHRRRLDVEVCRASVATGRVVVGLVCLMIQLLFHVRINQIQVIDVVYLNLGSYSCPVRQHDSSSTARLGVLI